MRSYEDKWAWLRGQLTEDAAHLDARAAEVAEYVRRGRIEQKRAGIRHALRLMDQADRNGPVEPL